MASITDALEKLPSSGKTVSQVWKNVLLELGPKSFPLYLHQFIPLASSSTLKMEAAGFSRNIKGMFRG
jgi:hypothetical protein